MPKPPKPCIVEDCPFPKHRGRHKCMWHYLESLPPEEQVRQARHRRTVMEGREGYEYRARVPQREWPADHRWCSGCQMFVPLFYSRGSMCLGHASLSAHSSHIERTYGLSREDYDALLAFQGGRCYICGQRAVGRRFAVDHDHLTGRVRGLLCSSDEWGCNHRIVGALEGKAGEKGSILELAKRIVAYFEQYPYDRMLAAAGRPPRPDAMPLEAPGEAVVPWGWGGPPPAEDPLEYIPF